MRMTLACRRPALAEPLRVSGWQQGVSCPVADPDPALPEFPAQPARQRCDAGAFGAGDLDQQCGHDPALADAAGLQRGEGGEVPPDQIADGGLVTIREGIAATIGQIEREDGASVMGMATS